MTNPNKTVWAFRNRKSVCVRQFVNDDKRQVQTWLKAQKLEPGDRKRLTSFKVGKRGSNQRSHVGRIYRKLQ